MSKKKHHAKLEQLKNLMLQSKYWAIKEDVQEVYDFHLSKIEEKLEKGFTPTQILAQWPNW